MQKLKKSVNVTEIPPVNLDTYIGSRPVWLVSEACSAKRPKTSSNLRLSNLVLFACIEMMFNVY